MLDRFRQGDANAFASLYRTHWNQVFRFSRLYLKNDEDAEDVVQEVFIRLWQIHERIHPDGNFSGLLFIITRNLIFNRFHKQIDPLSFKVSVLAALESSDDIESEVSARDLAEYINRLIDLMPARQRQVFNMSRREHKSYREIAEELSVFFRKSQKLPHALRVSGAVPGIYYGYRKKHEMTDIKTLVRKLLAGKLPQKEMPELWQRHDVTQYMQREWDRCAKPAEDDLLRESRIWERIVARTMPHEKIRRKRGVRTAWLSRSYGAAASIMLAIGAGLTLVNLLWRPAPEIIHTLYSGNQSTEQVALPDGSTLWLGANSSCRYAADFSGRERRVELNGQGFFEVAEDPSRPFVVSSNGIDVTALGTAFEVFSDLGGRHVEAILRNGSVRVSLPGVTKQTFTLSPDQKFTYSADTRKVIVSRVDAQRYTLWHERMSLSFENQPLSVILPRLERWYNCHIDCPEEIATRYHYTFSLSDETLDRTLQLLQSSTDQTPLFYRRDGMYVRIYEK